MENNVGVPEYKKKTKMEVIESVKDVVDATVEPGMDKIMEVGDSPSLLPMEERTGGDDFLKMKQPASGTPVQEHVNNPAPQPQPIQQNTGFNQPVNNLGSPKEFSIQDPETALMEKQKQMRQAQQQEVAKEISKESGNMLADMLVDGFGMVAPELATSYYSINEVQIKSLEKENKVPPGSLMEVKKWNKDHANQIKFTKEQRDFIHTPLVKVLEIHSVKADPTTMLIIGICIVCFMMFWSARSIKKDGDEMVENLIVKYEESRKRLAEEERKIAELPLTPTETV